MTTQQAAHGEIQAFERPMLADGFHGILRTSGREAARGGRHGGNHAAIELNGDYEHGGQETAEGVT